MQGPLSFLLVIFGVGIAAAQPPLTITTTSLPNGTIGAPYSQTLQASGGVGQNTWSVSTGSLPAGLTLSSAGVISGTPTATGTANFSVQVTDNRGSTATQPLSITIAPLPLTITTTSLPNGTVGVGYSQTLTATGGTGGYSWAVSAGSLPAGLTLSTAGVVSGTPTTAGPANFTVQVTDSVNTTATQPLSITIAPPPLTITTTSLPNGVVGVGYSQTLTATGGTGGYSWAISAGSLPAGLTLSTAGVISGTPSGAGPANFTVRVTDSVNTTATQSLAITIAPPVLTITTTSLPNGTVGVGYSQTLTASGGSGGFSWSVITGSLPPGLTLSAAGVISGTPNSAGTAIFTVQVMDISNATAAQSLAITIAPPVLTITTTSLPNGTVGVGYSQTLTASGGSGGFSWSVITGSLPPGLTLSAAGVISGTPNSAGTAIFTVQVMDISNATAAQSLAITIAPPVLTITTTSLPNGTVGAPYSQTLQASGGSGGYTWALSNGSLPAGLTLSAAGVINGTPTGTGTANFTVQVTDSSTATATQPLAITIAPPTLTINTTSLPNGTVGVAYSQTLIASGGSGGYTWAIATGSLPAGLTLSASGLITGTPTGIGTANFTVQVTDSSTATATQPLAITIAPPALTITTTSLPNGNVSVAYSQSLAATGGTGGYTWALASGSLPAGLTLSPGGLISGTPTTVVAAGFTVRVTDSSTTTATQPLSITIGTPPLTITTTSLPNGTVGVAYSQTLTASGGSGGYTWTITTGSLPAGLTLNAAGLISGTPTGTGTANFTVRVTDSSTATATQPLSITIGTPPLTITRTSLPNGTTGVAYSQTLTASGGAGGYTWTITTGSLPAGLTLSTAGVISGTPTGTGAANFTVRVTDTANATATQPLSITIGTPALTITRTSLPNGTTGVAYSQTLTASGGAGGYTWTITTGSLPAGLTLSTAGVISGTPTGTGAANFTVRVTDTANATATQPLSITIGTPVLTITRTSLPNGATGVAYSQTLTASGGAGGYTWTIATGSLPAGLTLSTAGVISGTPTGTGAANFTVRVRDSANATATQPLSITIGTPALTITRTSLPNGAVGVAYLQNLTASGGSGGYTWTITAGSLPAGLTLSLAGLISGTPTGTGIANFTVRVTDSANANATQPLSITVAPPALTIVTPTLPAGTAGVAYSQAFAASGGTGAYTWTVISGSLPAGLTLSAGGLISGTPISSGNYVFEVRVTDTASATAIRGFIIAVATPVIVTQRTLRNGVVGNAYTESLTASGGASPYTWSIVSGQLPTGLTLNRSTGAISGVPTLAGVSNFVVEAADSGQQRGTASFAITINRPLTVASPAALTTASAGTSYSQTFTASGGEPPYAWSITGSLPTGLTFSAGTGLLSGTPTQVGTFPITVRVRDAGSATAERSFSVQVVSGLAIATAPVLPPATSGTVYSATLQPVGGTAPYQWTISAGSLPSGLAFSPSGQISGTPVATGNFVFTVQVTDANSNRAQKEFTLTVAGALIITTGQTLPAGATQALYSQTLAATGGTPPYLWTVTAGALPPGLLLDAASGALNGRPTATGTFNFTVSVTDSISVSTQRQFTLVVGQGLTFVSPASLPDASAGVAYSFTLLAGGGVPPYSWSLSEGALPNGLALNAASGVISGVPAAPGTFNFTVRVQDSSQTNVTRPHSIIVALPAPPEVSISGLPAEVQPLQQPLIDIAISNPYPVPLNGILSLSFTPLGSNPDDPAVQFSTGGRSAAFTIPAGATHASFGGSQFAVQTGSVAGTITLRVLSLQSGGTSLPVPANLTQAVQVSRAVPVIRSVSLTRTSDGVQVQITAMSNTRELTQATVVFQAATGSALQTSQLVVPLQNVARSWFQSSDSTLFGGQFSLTLPFSFSGSVSLSSISVTLASEVGASSPASVNY